MGQFFKFLYLAFCLITIFNLWGPFLKQNIYEILTHPFIVLIAYFL